MSLPDSFGGSEGDNLQTYSASWTRHTSYSADCEIASGRARQSATGASGYYTTDFSPASADYEVEADIYVAATSRQSRPYICGRMSTSANTFYAVRLTCLASTSGTFSLWKFVAGTSTQLGSDVAVMLAASGTHNIRLVMAGTSIKGFLNDVEEISVTDSSITAAGKAGIRYPSESLTPNDSTGLHIDNFDAYASGGTNYQQSMSASLSRSASLSKTVQFGELMSAAMSRSASLSASPTIGQQFSAALSRSASMLAEYIEGSGPILAGFKNLIASVQSAIKTVFDRQ